MNEFIIKEPIVSYNGAEFTGDSKDNKDTWRILRKGKNHATIFEIIESDLKLELYQYKKLIEHKCKWLGFFGIAAPFFIALISSDFNDVYFVEAALWEMGFLVSTILFIILGVISFVEYYRDRDKYSVLNILKRLCEED